MLLAPSPETTPASVTFRAMGTSAHVMVFGTDPAMVADLTTTARAVVDELERLWSRFLPDSDVGRINRSPNRPVRVDPRTVDLVTQSIDAWALTGGRFDPTVGGSLRAAGYDRPFDELAPVTVGRRRPAPSPVDVLVHPIASTITVPMGVELDLGGIGKGAATDLTVQTLLDAGAAGALVNLGGDLRAGGHSPLEGWIVRLACPGSREERTIRISTGAVCTSSTVKRRWRTDSHDRHHIIDPTSGRSSTTDVQTATVVGAEATQCEVLATTAIGLGLERARLLIESHGASGLLIDAVGELHEVGPLGDFA
jgi:thiamine biosynthesis lipoprotein